VFRFSIGERKISFKVSRPRLKTTQPPFQRILGAFILEIKWLGRKDCHLPATASNSLNEWSYPPTRNMLSRGTQGQLCISRCFRVLLVSPNSIELLVILLEQQNVYKRWELNFHSSVKYPCFCLSTTYYPV